MIDVALAVFIHIIARFPHIEAPQTGKLVK